VEEGLSVEQPKEMNEEDGFAAAVMVVVVADPGGSLKVEDWHQRSCYSGSVAVVAIVAAAGGIVVGGWGQDRNLQHCRF